MLIGKSVRLQPNREQEHDFKRFASTSRFAWNESKAFYDKAYKDEKRYCCQKDLVKHLQVLKHNDPSYEWLNTVPEAITKQAVKDLLKAYQKAYKDRKGRVLDVKSHNKHLPKFKKKGRCVESFYQRTDNIHKTDDTHVKITGIKTPVKCSMLKGTDLPEHIYNPRIKYDGKYWYLSYSYETKEDITPSTDEAIGVDLGIKDLAILSDGRVFKNINRTRTVRNLKKRRKRLQRQLSRKYEANKRGDRFIKTGNVIKLERQIRLIDRRLKNIRNTYIHTVTKDLVRNKPKAIVIEDLNVSGLLKNRHLSKAIQEQEFHKCRQQIEYKCAMNNIEVVTVPRFYPSSKRCSNCGSIKKDLKLNDRTYRCDSCGISLDRDYNASLNLMQYYYDVTCEKVS